MNAFVAVTDRDWFEHLSALDGHVGVDEVNFWQPSAGGGRFRALRRGEPLLFKLRAPTNAIVGGGFYEHYTELPMSLAWDAFGEKNGAASRQAVWDRIARLRRGSRPEWYEDFTIGCIILVEPFFWPEKLWIPQPEDWSGQIVRGKTYDLRDGIGRRLWDQVALRLSGVGTASETAGPELPGGYSDPVPTRHRLGQGAFRVVVTDAYGRACAITRERALPTLEAAHIRPFSDLETHSVTNGLLLRSDLHRLFDAGYITVTPEHRVEASRRMREDFNDGENYLKLHGQAIVLPKQTLERPDRSFLAWHNENRYRG